jgi:hypothetical protein
VASEKRSKIQSVSMQHIIVCEGKRWGGAVGRSCACCRISLGCQNKSTQTGNRPTPSTGRWGQGMGGEEGEWLAALGNKMDRMWCDLTAKRQPSEMYMRALSLSHNVHRLHIICVDGVYEIPTSQSEGLSQYSTIPTHQSGTVC